MPRSIALSRVDAFTDRPFAGNPAGVVLDADGLAKERMQAIAAELRVAGTAFVSPPLSVGADFRLRWFTPTREVAYSGHTTVACVHALGEAGRLHGSRIVFDTLRGFLEVRVEGSAGGPVVWLLPALPACRPFAGPVAELARALGLASGELGGWAPPTLTPDGDVVLAGPGLAALHALRPDMDGLARVATEAGIRGVCVVSRETVEAGSSTHCRFFAPHFGIPEDIVTGSVHSSIAVWLVDAAQLTTTGDRIAFTAEQGDCLGRPGRLRVEAALEQGRLQHVRVGGRAVTVLRGEMCLPDGERP